MPPSPKTLHPLLDAIEKRDCVAIGRLFRISVFRSQLNFCCGVNLFQLHLNPKPHSASPKMEF